MLFGKLRQSERGLAKRRVGAGRRAGASPHRPHDAGRASGRQCRAVYVAVSGSHASLRCDAGSHQCLQRSRERRLRAEPSSLQGCPRAGVAVAWQPGLPQPGGILAVGAWRDSGAKRGPRRAVQGRIQSVAGLAPATTGDNGTTAGACEPGQHGASEEEHLLGAGAADW
jgi:hypothetical protein